MCEEADKNDFEVDRSKVEIKELLRMSSGAEDLDAKGFKRRVEMKMSTMPSERSRRRLHPPTIEDLAWVLRSIERHLEVK